MSAPFESRRGFLRQMIGGGLLGSLAGCTAFGTARVDIVIENTGTREERTEYYLDQGDTTLEAQTIELKPGEEQTIPLDMERGDSVIISKGDLGFECTLTGSFCRDPTLQIDTGFGALGVSGECFNISQQQ